MSNSIILHRVLWHALPLVSLCPYQYLGGEMQSYCNYTEWQPSLDGGCSSTLRADQASSIQECSLNPKNMKYYIQL